MGPTGYRLLCASGLFLSALGLLSCGTTSAPLTQTVPTGQNANTVAAGPALAAWWDAAAGGLRTEYGVPGASWQGAATDAGGQFASAAVCMRGGFALFSTKAGALFLGSIRQGVPAPIAGQNLPQAQIVFSPSCSAALAYSGSAALLIQGLSGTPQVSSVALPSGAASPAVADSGSILVSVPQTGGTAEVELIASGSTTPMPVTTLLKTGGLAFLPHGDTALLADAGRNIVLEASQMSAGVSITQVAGPADGVAQPVAVAASADGRTAAVLNGSGGSLLRVDLTGQSATIALASHGSPTELVPLAGNFAFRINEPGSGTVWAYDGDAPAPRIVFLPSAQAAVTASAPVSTSASRPATGPGHGAGR